MSSAARPGTSARSCIENFAAVATAARALAQMLYGGTPYTHMGRLVLRAGHTTYQGRAKPDRPRAERRAQLSSETCQSTVKMLIVGNAYRKPGDDDYPRKSNLPLQLRLEWHGIWRYMPGPLRVPPHLPM
jgi:hypothetical protein